MINAIDNKVQKVTISGDHKTKDQTNWKSSQVYSK